MGENKVRFGLKNVYYSKLTESTDSTNNTFATPVAVPGAVSLTLDANVADNTFYADNISYFKSMSNNGYSGTLEMARFNDTFMKDIFGEILDNTTKVLTESTGIQPKPFTLLFQIEGDANEELYVLYRVVPTSKPTFGSGTVEEAPTPVTQSFDFDALPLVTGPTYQKGLIKARTTDTTTTTVRTNWFTTVQIATTA